MKTRVLLLFLGLALIATTVSFAHVTVLPREGRAGVSEEFTFRVPNETKVDMVALEITFPTNLNVSYVQTKPGWKSEMKTDAKGKLLGVVWTGGVIGASEYTEFKILGRAAREDAELLWKAVEVYKDGKRDVYDGPKGSRNAGPISTVKAPGQ